MKEKIKNQKKKLNKTEISNLTDKIQNKCHKMIMELGRNID